MQSDPGTGGTDLEGADAGDGLAIAIHGHRHGILAGGQFWQGDRLDEDLASSERRRHFFKERRSHLIVLKWR